MFKKQVILVDETDKPIGKMEKIRAHQLGILHRAFSVFIFNSQGQMLLQKRAQHKYHTPGLWSNACCSHPNAKKNIARQAQKRLKAEVGIKINSLTEVFSFVYKAPLHNNLIEHEFDYVFIGQFNGQPKINKKEAGDYQWINPATLQANIAQHPEQYTPWLKIILPKLLKQQQNFLEIK